MVTSMAALENGLDPNFTINDPGVIMLGKNLLVTMYGTMVEETMV